MHFATSLHGGEQALARLIRDEPPGLPQARAKLTQWLTDVRKLAGDVPVSKVVLSGFSQVCF